MRKEFYDEYYRFEDRHWWFVGRRRIFIKVLDRFLPRRGVSPDGREVLDIGCGTGTMLGYLSRYGQATGIDMDESAVAYCRERGLTSVIHTPEIPWPFHDGRFALVTMFDVLEHVDDDHALLREIHRVLASGGHLLVAVPAYRFLWGRQDEIAMHKRRYTARQLRSRLREAGFSLRYQTYFNTILFPPIALMRLARRVLPKPDKLESDFTVADNSIVNRAMSWIFSSETAAIPAVRLPFGVSMLAIAEKP